MSEFGKLLALHVRRLGEYELTLENEEVSAEVLDGLRINGVYCDARALCTSEKTHFLTSRLILKMR